MNLIRRLEKLEQETAAAGEGVVGIMSEGQEEAPDGVTVWPGGERMSAATFRARYPAGILATLADYSLPHYGGDAADEEGRPWA